MVKRRRFPDLNLDQDLYSRLLGKRSIAESGCWEWTGRKNFGGYGLYVHYQPSDQRQYPLTVTRLIASYHLGLELFNYSRLVCHHCDNPGCFNPKHLYLGNESTNRLDSWKRNPKRVAKIMATRTHCKHGHELAKHGVWKLHHQSGKMRLQCRVCHSVHQQKSNRKRRQKEK